MVMQMNKTKNILIFTGIWLYIIYSFFNILVRIPSAYTPDTKIYAILCAVFSIILWTGLPGVLLISNLKNKTNRFFSVVVIVFGILSLIIVAIKLSPILSYLMISKLGLLDTYWQYYFFEILPVGGVVSIICFVFITVGAIMSCKKGKE